MVQNIEIGRKYKRAEDSQSCGTYDAVAGVRTGPGHAYVIFTDKTHYDVYDSRTGERRTNCYDCLEAEDLDLYEDNEGEPMRTFKLLKDTPTQKKGTLFQSQGQNDAYSTILSDVSETIHRAAVEEQPDWFVEVFKAEPEYLTQEELDAYQKFLKGRKTVKLPAKTKKHKGWSAARRKAHSQRMKAAYAKKAQA